MALYQSFIRYFQKPPAVLLAQRELEENERLLLEAQRTKAYASKMVEFYETRIRDLNAMLKVA